METKKITDPTCRYPGRAHQDQQRRVVTIGDSHARRCAPNMTHIFKDSFKVHGVVKPGACSETLTCISSVNHDMLLSKLEHYGIKERANDVIKSYLSDRFQRVLVVSDSIKYYSKWEASYCRSPSRIHTWSLASPSIC
jgi:hypothetical protein